MSTRAAALAAFFATHMAHASVATELVMFEGTSIEVSQDGSVIRIVAGDGLDRRYEFDGCSLKSRMGARGGRWMGSLGIYDPAGPGFSFSSCKGISRTVVAEGQIHFDDMSFADEWIRRQQRAAGKTGHVAWASNGLLVSWNTVPNRVQLNVDVWRMCFHAAHPTKWGGATDRAIQVQADRSGQTIRDCAVVGKDVIDQTRKDWEEEWRKYSSFR
ncbi:MAG: hypothetical protein V4476_18115 [Pseudomonadota bacterium]